MLPPGYALVEHDGRLELRGPAFPRVGAVYADWLSADQKRRVAAGKRQPLARACGLHKRRDPRHDPRRDLGRDLERDLGRDLEILDATAGFGRDAWVLAALGARVTLCERNPAMRALLADALGRARAAPETAVVAARLELIDDDSQRLLAGPRRWDAIYLDPMYPEDGKTALPGKAMQLLRELAGADHDADALLAAAVTRAPRVAVKRPASAPSLGGPPPSQALRATQVRYDLYLGG